MKEGIVSLVIVGLLLATFALVYTQKPGAITISKDGDIQGPSKLSVSGEALKFVAPDEVESIVRIETTSMFAKEAQDRVAKVTSEVINALKSAGIKQEDIQTLDYSLQRVTDWDTDQQKSVDRGFRQTHRIKVTSKNIPAAGNLVDMAVKLGENIVNVEGVQFTLSREKQQEIREELLADAGENARKKADVMAKSLGVRVTSVLSASESYFYIPKYAAFEMAARTAAPEIPAQEVSVSAQVQVEFEIE